MNEQRCTASQLVSLYREYLDHGRSAAFVASVSRRYALPTLHRMTESPDHEVRRAAVLSLGMLGGGESIAAIGSRLRDTDRCVRLVAEMAFAGVTQRQMGVGAGRALEVARRHLEGHRYRRALGMIDDILGQWPEFSAAWHLRSVARFDTRRYRSAFRSAAKAYRWNTHHYGAVALMARCYLELDMPRRALTYFEKSLAINPSQTWVQSYIEVLVRRAKRMNRGDIS